MISWIGAYLHSYLSISDSADSRPPSLGRRRRGQKANDTPATSASELFTPFEALRLNVLVSPNVEACYQQITTFFRDSELVPAGTQGWEVRFCLLCNAQLPMLMTFTGSRIPPTLVFAQPLYRENIDGSCAIPQHRLCCQGCIGETSCSGLRYV